MVPVQPEPRIADQEGLHLSPAVVENITVPIGMESLPHVSIFIGVGAVKKIEPMVVIWEMRGHPVQDHADTFPVKGIYQRHKTLRVAKPRSGGIVAGALITPAPVERM